MSRLSKIPIKVPDNVQIKLEQSKISIIGKKGTLNYTLHKSIKIKYEKNKLFCFSKEIGLHKAQTGTTHSILNSMIIGVTNGFKKKLQIFGVGYRVILKKDIILLSLGYSHPIEYKLPEDVKASCPSQTEIILTGINKQTVGQVAAKIRSFKKPEPYKGKGIRYENEIIKIKETKKK
ncbi:MAG: 50S ribosomal protein L6 [Arsenophonus sp.]|nr:MAG: 50S ribosomal protein L6 [Arsenophonus sp.]